MKRIIEEELYLKIGSILDNYNSLLERLGDEFRNSTLEDDWIVLETVLDEYDSLPIYESEKTEVNPTPVGRAARVTCEGLSYTTYIDFFTENAIEKQYTVRYDYGYSASEDNSYVVVGEGYHNLTNKKIYVLQNTDTSRVYLVAEEGVKIL